MAQKEHRQIFPKPGWVEHDPVEIAKNTLEVIAQARINKNISLSSIEACGITNQRETAVIMRHRPSGIQAKAESERTQIDNKRNARAELEARVAAHYAAEFNARHAADRKGQVGSGQRADKIRTYREQDDQVTDHRTGRKARLSDVRAGRLELVAE